MGKIGISEFDQLKIDIKALIMKIRELIEDMTRIETDLSRFEKRFGVKSTDFFRAMNTGELEEFDALDEYRMDFIEWLALYKTWLSLDESCRT